MSFSQAKNLVTGILAMETAVTSRQQLNVLFRRLDFSYKHYLL